MKEAIANAGVFNLIIVFVTILMLFFVGSLGYSKAYKVKDRVIREIEKNKDYNEDVKAELEEWLSQIGYRYKGGSAAWSSCPVSDGADGTFVDVVSVYDFCVYKHEVRNSDYFDGYYYSVISYMYFELPIFKDMFRIPVRGETSTFINEIKG